MSMLVSTLQYIVLESNSMRYYIINMFCGYNDFPQNKSDTIKVLLYKCSL